MTNDQFRNAPDHPVMDKPGTSVTAPDLLSPEELQLQRLANLSHEIRRLYAWLGLLTGLSVLSLGLLTGFAIWLKVENNQLQRQISAINAYKAEIDRVKTLETRLITLESQANLINQSVGLLNQQVPKGLPTQLKTMQNDISSLKTLVQRLEANTPTREQVNQSIQRALNNQNQNRVANPPAAPKR